MPTFMHEDKLGAPFAEALKAAVSHTRVQAESHIRTPENADTVIASGQADMVSIVRGQIADPHMASKAFEDRPSDIRPCIFCNQMCWGRRIIPAVSHRRRVSSRNGTPPSTTRSGCARTSEALACSNGPIVV
jgi:2,4-dienoyl-CoA reductase-like NADH-dependent reductase (Old Yellow Enzyme family)